MYFNRKRRINELPYFRIEKIETWVKRAFRHVAGVIWNSCVGSGFRVIPDFMTAGGLPVKYKPLGF